MALQALTRFSNSHCHFPTDTYYLSLPFLVQDIFYLRICPLRGSRVRFRHMRWLLKLEKVSKYWGLLILRRVTLFFGASCCLRTIVRTLYVISLIEIINKVLGLALWHIYRIIVPVGLLREAPFKAMKYSYLHSRYSTSVVFFFY